MSHPGLTVRGVWVNDVYNKLRAWSPLKAMEFRPDPSPITKQPANVKQDKFLAIMMKDFETNHSRQNLNLYGKKLAEILDEARKEENT